MKCCNWNCKFLVHFCSFTSKSHEWTFSFERIFRMYALIVAQQFRSGKCKIILCSAIFFFIMVFISRAQKHENNVSKYAEKEQLHNIAIINIFLAQRLCLKLFEKQHNFPNEISYTIKLDSWNILVGLTILWFTLTAISILIRQCHHGLSYSGPRTVTCLHRDLY